MKDELERSLKTQARKLIQGVDKAPNIQDQLGKQVGCLCYKWVEEKLQILLITSLTTKSWIVPKGWIQKELGPSSSAEVEAWEEAGILGICSKRKFGNFDFTKILKDVLQLNAPLMFFP